MRLGAPRPGDRVAVIMLTPEHRQIVTWLQTTDIGHWVKSEIMNFEIISLKKHEAFIISILYVCRKNHSVFQEKRFNFIRYFCNKFFLLTP